MREAIATLVTLAAIIALVVVAVIERDDETDAARDTLQRFCRATQTSVGVDLSALRSGNPSLQKQAIRRVTDDRIYFGDSSARICLGARMPDAEAWSGCLFIEDAACVLARTERLHKLLEASE